MLIQNKSKYKVVTLSSRKAEIINSGENLAKNVLPLTLYIKIGLELSLVAKVETSFDKLIIKDSLVENEVEVEFVE